MQSRYGYFPYRRAKLYDQTPHDAPSEHQRRRRNRAAAAIAAVATAAAASVTFRAGADGDAPGGVIRVRHQRASSGGVVRGRHRRCGCREH